MGACSCDGDEHRDPAGEVEAQHARAKFEGSRRPAASNLRQKYREDSRGVGEVRGANAGVGGWGWLLTTGSGL
jgi:hypothetical protein